MNTLFPPTALGTMSFDHPDHLNPDGSVTIQIVPSNWRCENISPDTYQLFNGDGWVDSTMEYFAEETDAGNLNRDLNYDDFDWVYDHAAIVRDIAEELAGWIHERLLDLGLSSASEMRIVETWSPREYNFTSDGFHVEFDCDPAQLRDLTPDFDVDTWARAYYGSVDGFASFIPGRMEDPKWHADYDGEFRVEHLIHLSNDKYDEVGRSWRNAVDETLWEIYDRNTSVTLIHPEFMDSGFTLPELEEWARLCDFTDNPSTCATLF